MGEESILVVEDEPEISTVVSRMLRRAGYAVTEACGVAEAQEAFRVAPKPFALIVCDVVLPDKSGAALVAHAMRLYPTAKVLLMSGLPLDILTARGLLPPDIVTGGRVYFRQKPFSFPELMDEVSSILTPQAPPPEPNKKAGLARATH